MKKTYQYINNIQKLIQQVLETQMENIDAAGSIIAESLMNKGFVYTFGTGHSHMMAEELFYRAGGLARVYPILEEALMLHNGAIKSTDMERLGGYAELILNRYDCSEKDCLIIASNSGRNPVNIEMVTAAQKRGMKVIGLTNLTHSKAQESRHVSGKKLYQLVDVVIDNQGCLGDASVFIPQINRNIAATSTSLGAMILQATVIAAIEIMLEKNFIPEVFSSSNLDEGDTINERILADYKSFVKPL
ncbi:MAG: SIS domain-containing protein [Sediminibacterium sp.]|nr:SIS domain-containing protein [Sediminibacterium sp.]